MSEPRNDYNGETKLLLFQNFHRYFLYLGLVFIAILTYDAIRALFWGAPAGAPFWAGSLEIHVGTLVLATNAFLLADYTLGCHSLRYLVGGKLRCFSCPSGPRGSHATDGGTNAVAEASKKISSRYRLWRGVTKLNTNHPTWAWFSLFMVAFADFYVWMVSIGVWTDYTLVVL